MPETILFTHPRDLQFIKNNYVTYIKRCISSNGRNISKLEKIPNKGYIYSCFTSKVVKQNIKLFSDVVRIINKIYPRNRTIIQKGIDLPSWNGRNIDMRATVQRNGQGELEITSIVARVALKDSPVTSTRTGSDCYRFEEFLEKSIESKEVIAKLRQRVNDFLLNIYRCTEKAYGEFGEIGIDFALDKDGKIWFIECNAKPAKDAMYKSYDHETIRKAFQYPLEYAKYITGFNHGAH